MISKKTAFNQIYQNSLLCYDLIKRKKHKREELENILVTKDYEKIACFLEDNSPFNGSKYQKAYSRLQVVDEVLDYTKDKYYHLREIRNIVRLDDFLFTVLDNKLYLQATKLFYTKQVFHLCSTEIYTSFFPYIQKKKN